MTDDSGDRRDRSEASLLDEAWSVRGSDQQRVMESPSMVDEGWEETRWEGFEPVPVDPALRGSRNDYPFASERDFEDDTGQWSAEDYDSAARVLFGDGPFFGEHALVRWQAEGYALLSNHDAYRGAIARYVPEVTASVLFVGKDNVVQPIGFVSLAAVDALTQMFPTMDWSGLHVTMPLGAGRARRRVFTLPESIQNAPAADWVDLRRLCTPVADQGHSMRAAAFAWTHAMELGCSVLGLGSRALSCNHAMMQLQRARGDYRDHRDACRGGAGFVPEASQGAMLTERGICPQALWPDDALEPLVSDEELAQEAGKCKLAARVAPVSLDQVKAVLGCGCPVLVTMQVGAWLIDLGRDGLLSAPEADRSIGQHTMLLVGYVGNYFLAKNSWGQRWGERGYCYVPKRLLRRGDARFEAVIWDRSMLARAGLDRAVQSSAAKPWQPAAVREGAQPTIAGFAIPSSGAQSVASQDNAERSGWVSTEAPAASRQEPAGATMVGVGSERLEGSAGRVAPTMCSPGEEGEGACPSCGARGVGDKYCKQCGARIENAIRFCMQCGAQLREGVKFCTQCAAPVRR